MTMVLPHTGGMGAQALMHRLPWVSLALAGLCLALHLVAGPAAAALVYDRQEILSGEAYRLLTGHLVHLDDRHLWLNLAALLLVGGLYEAGGRRRRSRRLLGLMAGSALAISATLLLLSPDTAAYCGLSAVLNAVFAAVTLRGWLRTRNPLWLLLALGGVAKIGFEWVFGPMSGAGLAWPPHYGAHLAGFLIGVADAAAEWWWRRWVLFARGVDIGRD